MLKLSEEDLKKLNQFIQEMPTKYGLPLINFLNAKLAEQNKEPKVEPEVPKEEQLND